MRPIAFLGLALAASMITALPAAAQEDTTDTDQATTEQGTEEDTQETGQEEAATTAEGSGEGTDQESAGQETEQAADEDGGQAAGAGEIHPLTITCREIVDTDIQLVPQLVYWINGYNIAYDAATGQTDVDPVVSVAENWLAVPANNIITACEANPESLASEVIAQERQKNEEAASN